MKIVSLVLLLIFPMASMAGESAYQALRAVGAQRNPDLLNRVLEVKGNQGSPQPELWTVFLDDPLARGGVREMELVQGKIISERTPLKVEGQAGRGVPMNFQKLNLDSTGAFALAETQAKDARVGFDSINYLLRCDQPGSAPAWVLNLQDKEKRSVGEITIAADSGVILKTSFTKETTKTGYRAFVENGGLFGATERASKSVGRTFRKTGATLEEFFTGDRTLDKKDQTDWQ